jgi:phospholipase C
VVSLVPVPKESALRKLSVQVVENNVNRTPLHQAQRPLRHPFPALAGESTSPIRHIVYITKENRTYDEVFGALGRGNGDSSLSIYGVPRTFSNDKTGKKVQAAIAMPNHIALANRFSISDNFYCDSDHSADGHRWLVNTYPNEWVETSTTAHYGKGKRHQSADAPGRMGFTGASGAIYPEDYNEGGAIWEHMQRHGIRFYNYGLGFEFAASFEEQRDKYTGIRIAANYPMPEPLFENTSRRFATFNMNIPDQFRVDMFEEEYKTRWLNGKEPFPQVITMMLPNDHAADPRPQDGYPYRASFMSDNDLAVGRVVELLSHSPYWPHMAIFITEDDAQGGLDHVDAHRSICMVISPYAKKGHVSSVHTSIVSIMKTMFLILNIPPVNLYDACTSDLSDCFSEEALNLEPYQALPVDKRLFDPQKALDPFDRNFNWKNVNNTPELDNPAMLRFEREEKYREYSKQQKH